MTTRDEIRKQVSELLHTQIELALDAMERRDSEQMWFRRRKISTVLNHLCGAVEESIEDRDNTPFVLQVIK